MGNQTIGEDYEFMEKTNAPFYPIVLATPPEYEDLPKQPGKIRI